MKFLKTFAMCAAAVSFAFADEAPTGAPVAPTSEEQSALNAIQGKIKGKIVWSSSRSHSTHDLWMMNADGSEKKQLTNSTTVDWFPRFSPDGKTIIFTRSKGGWTPENDANYPEKWDLWTINADGSDEKKVAENATWGTFRPDGKSIVFSRGANVYQKNLSSGEETLLLDGVKAFDEKGVILQEPNLSPDGKYLAITLRGSMRETGIWDIAKKKWNKSGDGCQIDFFADGSRVYRVNPTGNGGTAAPSEILWFTLKDGVQQEKIGFFGVPKAAKLMDLPGRRSHEYFPRVSADGKWLVWGATAKGHDHDIYDYELYLWQIGTPAKTAARLTYHTANDRWPDIWLEK
ncbi:MAG: PD40 domain-containing protein [Hallerella porci]|uniref:TolB family protein n=1 Tax=Hallerella TaxID=2815788 RepID=UPI000D049175|nr:MULTISPECIES: PD40 domain-containing protein [Hallerella]MCI5600396.1 PD40 domain-containing protein [Hallerella sp.]MDY3922613.1 PD40 domain-containing protein [Hallerella porci]